MVDHDGNLLYAGDGHKKNEPLPEFQRLVQLTAPESYLADQGLRDAVNVALIMGQPLLLTGEPGTGKTLLASSIAHEFTPTGFAPTPLLTFHTKSTSTAKDVFYHYDALRHFHDAHHRREPIPADDYIDYEALGLAIILSLAPDDAQRKDINRRLTSDIQEQGPVRSVVLIDEVDKAPRDLSNDLLNEIENMSFTVSETGRSFRADQKFRPVLILTSNSEKDLPDAFLRRCVFYHIEFPNGKRLEEIVRRRLNLGSEFTKQMLSNAIEHFEEIRKQPLKKKPATAELLTWLRVLEQENIDVGSEDVETKRKLASSYSLLAKNKDDMYLLNSKFIGELAEK